MLGVAKLRPILRVRITCPRAFSIAKHWMEFEQLAQSQFEFDESDFSSTPAVSNGERLIRSGQFLYGVTTQNAD